MYEMDGFGFSSSFRATKVDFQKVVNTVSWLWEKTGNARNEYGTSPELTTLITFLRIASPCTWLNIVYAIKKHSFQMSEIFWEGLQRFMNKRQHILCGDVDKKFIAENAVAYAKAIESKYGVMKGCI